MSGAWPTPEQEQMLLACLAAEPEATRALDRIVAGNGERVGEGCAQFLPLLYRRWPFRREAILSTGRKAYLTVWRQNRDRMLHLSSLLEAFQEQGIPCLILKGAALILAYYADPGLRNMRDFDLLVHERDLEAAIVQLTRAGYKADRQFESSAILPQVRIGHAWQFSLGTEQSCDLHWRPVVRCYSPEVAKLFWEDAKTVNFGGVTALVLSPTDQLFHVCAHGLQWDWVPQIRWVPDAMTILRGPVDWERLSHLATESCMRVRLGQALSYLRRCFSAPVPAPLP
ncbi:MAG: nucleotidyltransferase family protein, partial [Acidobacteriota bacterium]|nr:nucleotidyltransferase family protein [Acidobacteriota bacterium]